MSNLSIWPIDRTLSGIISPGQSGPGSNGNEGVLDIIQSSRAGASPSDCLGSYPGRSWMGGGRLRFRRDVSGVFYSLIRQGHSLRESYSVAEMQLVYSTAPADWAKGIRNIIDNKYQPMSNNSSWWRHTSYRHTETNSQWCSCINQEFRVFQHYPTFSQLTQLGLISYQLAPQLQLSIDSFSLSKDT